MPVTPLSPASIAMICMTAKVRNRDDHARREAALLNALSRLLLTMDSVTPTMSSVIVLPRTLKRGPRPCSEFYGVRWPRVASPWRPSLQQ